MATVTQPLPPSTSSEVLPAPEQVNGVVSSESPVVVELGKSEESQGDAESRTARNFSRLVLFQVLLRVGWIFKTESVVIPAVLDSVGAGAWMRALLPSLNRLGQTLPAMWHAPRLERQRLKKHSLAFWTVLMGVPFLGLAWVWPWRNQLVSGWGFSVLFLVAYGLFFAATGINQVASATLQGKLVIPFRRGRLMSVANSIGVVAAVTCAAICMPLWLGRGAERFDLLFLFTGVCFVVCGLLVVRIEESPSAAVTDGTLKHRRSWRAVPQWLVILKHDRRMRTTALVAWASGSSLILFPHYQPLGRESLGLGFEHLVTWVIVQNIGAAVFSAPFGWLADRYGNRMVIRWATGLMLCGPILAWGASHLEIGRLIYPVVFFFLGVTPVFAKLMSNYVLELVDESQHPSYLATLGLVLGLPAIVLSPLVGFAIDRFGFDPAFIGVSLLMALGWLASMALAEPREDQS
jgi:MFS family permease